MKSYGFCNIPDPTNPFGNPLGFGFSFGSSVSHLWCQNWSSGAPPRAPARSAGAGKMGVSLLIQEHFLHFLKKSDQVDQGNGLDFDLKGPNHLMVMSRQDQTRASLSSPDPKRSEYDLVWG